MPPRAKPAAGAVLFVGPTREMASVYAAADALLLPTFYEPSGLLVLEAFAHGLPVISTEFLGASELVREHRAGRIVEFTAGCGSILPRRSTASRGGHPGAAVLLAARARLPAMGSPRKNTSMRSCPCMKACGARRECGEIHHHGTREINNGKGG